MINLVVSETDADTRLDVFLAKQAGFVSREEAKKAIKEGRILVNQRPSKPSYQVKDGDVITGSLPERISPEEILKPEQIPLDIVYEDKSVIVVNKQAGLVVHPGARNYSGTMVHALLYHCETLAPQGSPLRPGIVHRLDKETSGLLVVAKTAEAYSSLIEQFKSGTVEKRYYALVYGRMKENSGTLETGIQRHPKDRKKMAVTLEGGKRAVTEWMVETWFKEFTLLKIVIKTGRTHQIRAHFSYLGHPVVGDSTYGGKKRVKTILDPEVRSKVAKLRRHLLHAFFLGFIHPETGERISFTSPLPEDFRGLLDLLSKKNNP
ncbi:MAG TPA: RluA family pseudouridine synthase [Deltaproteobacteria bacterium]|nr:RluA family pseudouridine synthase [Deltaproteobacteria bacterium]